MAWFSFSWQNFWFSFLALAFEGLPFVLIGSVISGAIAVFVPAWVITRLLPKNKVAATLASGFLGVLFPVCDCGVVPIVRRFLNKGLPPSCALTFMLASPIVNPIVAFSTYAAFRGQGPALNALIRMVMGYGIAVLVGLCVLRLNPQAILKTGALRPNRRQRTGLSVAPLPDEIPEGEGTPWRTKLVAAIRLSSDDFIDTAIYFVAGAAVAAVFNTAVNQAFILPLARQPILATGALAGLSTLMTLCSTSDAFIAATFTSFPVFARMAFLVFGPMFDLKLVFLYAALFRKRFIALLGVGLFLVVGLVCSQLLPILYASCGF
ncbi:MAG TPA: permease [Chthoniobacterales bacterium]